MRAIHVHIHDAENSGRVLAHAVASVPGRAAALRAGVAKLAGVLPRFKGRKTETKHSNFKAKKHAEPERKQLTASKHEMKLLPDLREKPKAKTKGKSKR